MEAPTQEETNFMEAFEHLTPAQQKAALAKLALKEEPGTSMQLPVVLQDPHSMKQHQYGMKYLNFHLFLVRPEKMLVLEGGNMR